jgi:hypothetical protein
MPHAGQRQQTHHILYFIRATSRPTFAPRAKAPGTSCDLYLSPVQAARLPFAPGCYLFLIVPHHRHFCKHKNGILGLFLRFQV